MAFEISRFDPTAHRTDLISLWRDLEIGKTERPHVLDRRFDWLYRTNPGGAATTWVARRDGGQMVGCASLYPHRVWFRGEEHLAGTGCDFAVSKDHRVLGPALSLQRSLVNNSQGDGHRFLWVRPDQPSIGLFKRVGYRHFRETERWVKVLRPERYAEDINNSQLVVAMSRMAAKGLEVLDQAFRIPLVPDLLKSKSEILDTPDERFDGLWSEARSAHTLTEVRDAAYLRWRHNELPLKSHQFFCRVDRKGERLLGYVCFSVENNVASVEDLFALDMGRNLDCLLVEFIHAMHREQMNAISVLFVDNASLKTKLKRLFFLRREQLDPVLVFFDPQAVAALKDGVGQSELLMFSGGMDI